jgi:hypothetical protein
MSDLMEPWGTYPPWHMHIYGKRCMIEKTNIIIGQKMVAGAIIGKNTKSNWPGFRVEGQIAAPS